MADNECLLLAQRGIVLLIQSVRVLVEKFILYFVFLEPLQTILTSKFRENISLDPHKVPVNLGRFHLKTRDRMIITNSIHPRLIVNHKERTNMLVLNILSNCFVKIGDLYDVIFFQDFPRNTQL